MDGTLVNDGLVKPVPSATKIGRRSGRTRVLIINAYYDPWRNATPTRLFVPRAMAPYFLAGHFNQELCEVRVWDEAFHGALLERDVFASADIVVFSGLTAALDRVRQLLAYFRHANPKVITVIGGPIARAFPGLCAQSFDYACMGDTEEITQVIEDVLGLSAAILDGAPRADLTCPKLGLGFVETTKNCNFACSFCALTGEARGYVAHTKDSISRQLDAVGKVHGVMLLDNNFFGNNRKSFEARVAMLGARVRSRQIGGWGCLVTGDFFANTENVALIARNGCLGIFCGVETLDPEILKSYNKKQSLTSHPLNLTQVCAENGVLFDYGMMVDFGRQTMAQVAEQIDSVLEDRRMRLPAFISTTIPIVGTPYFQQAADEKKLLPNVLLSDMDGMKLVERPIEPVDEVATFFGNLLNMRGRRRALVRHAFGHAWHWRQHLPMQSSILSLLMPLHRFQRRRGVGSFAQMRMTWREARPTYSATTDAPRLSYTPMYPMPAEYKSAFEPMIVTDRSSTLTETFEKARECP